jgi:hypothetical protein
MSGRHHDEVINILEIERLLFKAATETTCLEAQGALQLISKPHIFETGKPSVEVCCCAGSVDMLFARGDMP